MCSIVGPNADYGAFLSLKKWTFIRVFQVFCLIL